MWWKLGQQEETLPPPSPTLAPRPSTLTRSPGTRRSLRRPLGVTRMVAPSLRAIAPPVPVIHPWEWNSRHKEVTSSMEEGEGEEEGEEAEEEEEEGEVMEGEEEEGLVTFLMARQCQSCVRRCTQYTEHCRKFDVYTISGLVHAHFSLCQNLTVISQYKK